MHCKVFSNVSCLYLPAETFLPGCDNQKCISLLSNVASFLQYCLRSLKVVFCITFIEFYRHLEAIRSICCNQQFLLFLCDTAKAPAANAQCLYPTECFCLNNSFFFACKICFQECLLLPHWNDKSNHLWEAIIKTNWNKNRVLILNCS